MNSLTVKIIPRNIWLYGITPNRSPKVNLTQINTSGVMTYYSLVFVTHAGKLIQGICTNCWTASGDLTAQMVKI